MRPGSSRVSAAKAGGLGGIEDFLHAYSLSTKEGLALMVLAEALLRVPDAATADRLIEDKLATGDWSSHERQDRTRSWSRPRPGRSASPPASSSRARPRTRSWRAWSSASACRRCAPPRARRCGCSARISCSDRPSRRRSSAPGGSARSRYSFDMLGEGARTAADAERYFAAYAHAIDAIGASAGDGALPTTGPASRSSSRRCIRGSRRSRASGCMTELVPRAARACPHGARRTTSISPSMPRRPTGSNSRST